MSRTSLDGLLQTLNEYVEQDYMGLSKSAGASEKDVLDGDRIDLKAGGRKHPNDDHEMDNSVFKSKPIEDSVREETGTNKNLCDKRQREDSSVGQNSESKENSRNDGGVKSKVEKAAQLANRILESYRKEAAGDDEETDEEKRKEKKDKSKEEMESKEAGFHEFVEGVKREGMPYIAKVASAVDPNFANSLNYTHGAILADVALEKRGAILADAALEKSAGASDEQKAYQLGQELAQRTITKLAADLVAARPIIQDLVAKNVISPEERDSLIDALASAEVLSPESVHQATAGLENAEAVAAALLKSIEGVQGTNVIPPPSTTVIPTPEALPGATRTADSAAPITTTVSPSSMTTQPNEELAQKAEALLSAVNGNAKDAENELVIQAALNILNKRRKRG